MGGLSTKKGKDSTMASIFSGSLSPIFQCELISTSFMTSVGFWNYLITNKVIDARRRRATSEAYEAIPCKEGAIEGLPAFMAGLPASMQGLPAQAGNATDDSLLVDQRSHRSFRYVALMFNWLFLEKPIFLSENPSWQIKIAFLLCLLFNCLHKESIHV